METLKTASCCGPSCCAPTTAIPESRDIRDRVRDAYGQVARSDGDGTRSASMGYSAADLESNAAAGNLGLGCGNPGAIAALREGEVVLDLGSGAGFDAFLAAERVGTDGRVVGVDMTPEMLARARRSAVELGVEDRVEFREGHIEALPVNDASVDVVISNCVINLSPDKPAVFREAFRVLRPGGRLAVSDIVFAGAIPAELQALKEDFEAYVGCIAGAVTEAEYVDAMRAAGFVEIVVERRGVEEVIPEAAVAAGHVFSAAFSAHKP